MSPAVFIEFFRFFLQCHRHVTGSFFRPCILTDKLKGFLDVTGMSPAVFIEFYRVFSVFSFQCHRHVTKIQLAISQKFVNLPREKFLIAGFPLR
jgi:hypothetical protein